MKHGARNGNVGRPHETGGRDFTEQDLLAIAAYAASRTRSATGGHLRTFDESHPYSDVFRGRTTAIRIGKEIWLSSGGGEWIAIFPLAGFQSSH
jgi:hypothetical protein